MIKSAGQLALIFQGSDMREHGITIRKREVLHLPLQGFTNKQIANKLHISGYTARDHVSSLLKE